jgi:hypothetical protein
MLLWLSLVLFVSGCAVTGSISGLRPEYPEPRRSFLDDTKVKIVFVEVNSLQPTLQWESFPRQQDSDTYSKDILSRINNVTYDLKIWRADNDYPIEVIYTRQGLPKPLHKIKNPLLKCTNYFWTVRARFEFNGYDRVTEWGIIIPTTHIEVPDMARRMSRIPNPFYYRFQTPCWIPFNSEDKRVRPDY